jgi:8-oxo-dGTP pyrophosphatase MutT (NUDIX family)
LSKLIYPFGAPFRSLVAQRLAAFTRAPALDTHGLKRAAVAVTLLESEDGSGETAFVLTRRGRDLRVHKGQYALPGGRCDEGESTVAAALREVEEELGLSLRADDVLGMLDDYPTRSGYLITPIVIWAELSLPLLPNPEEVAAVHRIALAEIARPDAVDFVTIPQSDRRVIRIRMNGSLVHAPTAAVVYQFHEVLAGRHTRVAELEQPVFAWR